MRALIACAAALAALALRAGAADVGVSAGVALDSNLYEAPSSPARGWVNRVTLTARGNLAESPRFTAGLSYQGGVKRYWSRSGARRPRAGEVAVNDLSFSSGVRLTDAVSISGTGSAKLKTVHEVPGQEGYLRGAASAAAGIALARGLRADAACLVARDASRDDALPDAVEKGLTGGLVYTRSRRLRLRVGVERRRLDYDRAGLVLATDGRGGVDLAAFDRSDRQLALRAGAQIYRGGLFDVVYSYTATASNSYGYDYRAHGLRLLHALALPWQVDIQAYLSLQSRRYDEPASPSVGGSPDADEYEQTAFVMKASRPLTGPLSVAAQYSFYRNGSAAPGGFYRKHLLAVSLDASL